MGDKIHLRLPGRDNRRRLFVASILWLVCECLGFAAPAPVASVVKILSSPNPVVQGQGVTITAGVNWTINPAPSGTISVSDTVQCPGAASATTTVLGTITLGSATSASPGAGTLAVSSFPCTGGNTIVANYSGDANYSSGSSQPLLETVLGQFAPTTTSLTSSPNPPVAGQSVTLAASIGFTLTNMTYPTGTVTFTNTSTGAILGTGSVQTSGTGEEIEAAASITVTLPAGSYGIQAAYSGDQIYAASASPVLSVGSSTAHVATTTTLTASPNPVSQGAAVVLTATVTPASGSGTPTGGVTFSATGQSPQTRTLSSGTAAISIQPAPGSTTWTAAYSGDNTYGTSTSSPVTVTVNANKAAASVTLSAPSSAVYGQSVTIVANVAAPGPVTGTTQILEGTTVLASGTGTSVFAQTSSLSVGVHQLTASFAGDAADAAATSSPVTLTVSKAASAVSLSSSANPSPLGQNVVFSASVAAQAPGQATGTGTVQFMDGAASLGTATLSGGSASLGIPALTAGPHSITVMYGGDANLAAGTSAPLVESISSSSTTSTSTTATASNTSIAYGQTVTFAVTVAANGSSAPPSGTVQLVDGSSVVATGTLNQGAAQLVATLPAGVHVLTTMYGGSTTLSASNSAAVTVTVSKANATFQLAASANPAGAGQTITLTATASGLAAGVPPPSGTVQFMDAQNPLGTVSLDGGTASLPVSSLAIGTHQITVGYSGDTNFNSGNSQALALVIAATTPLPNIQSVSGAGGSVPPVTAISSNAYVMLKGSNFAPTGTARSLQAGDLVNGNLPTQLAGVCVQIGGVSAFITYVSSQQINVVAPAVPNNTVATVQVTTGCGTASVLTSNLMSVSTETSTPEFFYWVDNPNGQNPAVAVDNTTGAFVGAASLNQSSPTLTFTPAYPGEILDIYGASFGPTNPSFAPGSPPGTAAQVTSTPVVTLGPLTVSAADVFYAGVSPGTPGLYQLSIRVPAGLPDGDDPLVMTIGGISTPAGAFLTVKNR